MDTWVSDTLSDAGQLAFFEAVKARQEATENDRRERRMRGYVQRAGLVRESPAAKLDL